MREQFNAELEVLHTHLVKMGVIVEDMVGKSILALKEKNHNLAREIIELDDKVDDLEDKIEQKCVELIALYQPVAKDLRRITSTLKIITDLERMGDYVEDIAEIVIGMDEKEFVKPLVNLPQMTKNVQLMIHDSLDSFVNEDMEMAKEVAKKDDEIDGIYEKMYEELLSILITKQSEKKQIIELLLIGRYLERIADHNTNICERIIYMVSGERVQY